MNPTRSIRLFSIRLFAGGLICVVVLGPVGRVHAQDPPAKDATPAGKAEPGVLNEAEAGLSRRYKQFERTLLQMAEYLRKTEPERADLLIRAIGKSKEDRVALQMDQIMDLLKSEQLGDAIGREEHLVSNLKGLLELLQSEDRRHQLEEEKKWLESVNQEIGKLSIREKELRLATEKGGKLGKLAERQSKIGGDTKSLLEKIHKQDATRNAANRKTGSDKSDKSQADKDGKEGVEKENAEKQDGDKKDADKKQDEQQKPDGSPKSKENDEKSKGDRQSKGKSGDKSQKSKPGDQKKQDSQKKENGEKKPSDQQGSQEKSEGSQESPPSDQQESESERQQAQKKTPGREQIEQARRAMQQAEDELKRLEGTKALERQDEAIRKLAEAKIRLEKILRQLREEEQEIMLTSLEARFAKMLLMEIQLHLDTITLSKTAKNAWTPKHFGKARDLSVQQESIGDEAFQALRLLKEEGS